MFAAAAGNKRQRPVLRFARSQQKAIWDGKNCVPWLASFRGWRVCSVWLNLV